MGEALQFEQVHDFLSRAHELRHRLAGVSSQLAAFFGDRTEDEILQQVHALLADTPWERDGTVMVIRKDPHPDGKDFGVQRLQFSQKRSDGVIFMEVHNWFLGQPNAYGEITFGFEEGVSAGEAVPILNQMLGAFRKLLGAGFDRELPAFRIVAGKDPERPLVVSMKRQA